MTVLLVLRDQMEPRWPRDPSWMKSCTNGSWLISLAEKYQSSDSVLFIIKNLFENCVLLAVQFSSSSTKFIYCALIG